MRTPRPEEASEEAAVPASAAGRATRPVRVLHVLDHWLPRPDGYASRSAAIVAGQRDAAGFEPAVLVTSRQHIGGSDPAQGMAGVRVLSMPEAPGEARLRRLRAHHLDRRRLHAAIVAAVQDTQADVVHVHWSSVVGATAVAAASDAGALAVAEVRFDLASAMASASDRLTDGGLAERLLRPWFERHLQRADAIVAASWSLAEAVSRATGRVAHTVPNGVDSVRFAPRDDAEEPSAVSAGSRLDGPLQVGAVSNLLPYEGFERLVPAIADVRRRGVDVEGHLVGGGAVLPAIERAAERHDVPFALPGRVPRRTAPDHWRHIDIACLPRRRSTITEHASPLKLVEAMATGLPTVASGVGDVSHLLAGGRGVVVDADDDRALADALAELGRDDEARRVMGKRAREHVVANYTWARSVARYERVYREAARG